MQYDSPLGFDMQDPPCRQGDGEHDIKPENSKQRKNFIFALIFDNKNTNEYIRKFNDCSVPVNI